MPEPANDNEEERRKAEQKRPCALCGKPSSLEYRPFCSKRCADLDLGRWLGGRYAVEVPDAEDEMPPDESEPESDI